MPRACRDRTEGNGFALKEGGFGLDLRIEFFTVRVVRPWPRLPREAVATPSLAVLKARLGRALSTLGWWKMSLPVAECWNWMICKVPSNLNYSVIHRASVAGSRALCSSKTKSSLV